MKKVKEQCLNCRNYTQGICNGMQKGKCNIFDPIHTKENEKDWWEDENRDKTANLY